MSILIPFFKFLRFCFAFFCTLLLSFAWAGWFTQFPVADESNSGIFFLFWIAMAGVTTAILYITSQYSAIAFGRAMAFAAGLGFTGAYPAYLSDGMDLAGTVCVVSLVAALIAVPFLRHKIVPDVTLLDQVSKELKHLNGFADFYRKNMEEWILSLEKRRKHAVPRMWIGICFVMPLSMLLTGAFDYYIMPDGESMDWFVAGVFVLISLCGVALAAWPYIKIQEEVKEKTLEKLLIFFPGLSYNSDHSGFSAKIFENAGLVQGYTKQKVGEFFFGKHENVDFLMIECELTKITGSGKNRREDTVFDGLMVVLTFPNPFNGHTIAMKNGRTPNVDARKFERVNLVHSGFEKLYDIYSTDQVEAREILGPDLMWNMMVLGETMKGKNRITELQAMDKKTIIAQSVIEMAFLDNSLFMTIPSFSDFFEIGNLDAPMSDTTRIARFVREVGMIYEIIDTLELRRKAR